jgi:DNA-binding transcriptional ArsR family regulator
VTGLAPGPPGLAAQTERGLVTVPDEPAGVARTGDPGDVLAAMADPTRRRLLAALANRGPATATELAGGLPISRQAVTKHLAALHRAGLVTSSRRGRDVRFEVRTENVAQTADWLADLAAEWDARLAAIKRFAEASG